MNARRALAWMLLAHMAMASAADWSPATVPLSAIQVSPRCWYVEGRLEDASTENQGFMSNAGFVITDESVVVFDALGTPALADLLVQEIKRHTELPISRVIISHYHADHFYGVPALRAAGAEVWAHEHAQRYLRSDVAKQRLAERQQSLGPWLGPEFTLAHVDRWLTKDERFELGGVRFSLRHVGPGHAPEDLAMLVEPDGVLYSGDTVYAGRVPFVGDADTRGWLGAIERLMKIPARVLVPGHGPASQRPRADLQLTHDYLTYLRAEMARAVADFIPFAEAYAQIDWHRFSSVPTFNAANRNNAYNVYLQMEEEALHGK